jgi:hypothetical protein
MGFRLGRRHGRNYRSYACDKNSSQERAARQHIHSPSKMKQLLMISDYLLVAKPVNLLSVTPPWAAAGGTITHDSRATCHFPEQVSKPSDADIPQGLRKALKKDSPAL